MKKLLFNIRNFYADKIRPIIFFHKNKGIYKTSSLPATLLKQYCSKRYDISNYSLCNAPFNSLFLGIDGYVIPCCFNRKMKLGSFNTQSILDIWNGEKIADFRNEFINFRFPDSCFQCKNHFMSGNFPAMGAERYDHIPVYKNQPAEIIFELSDECNYRCIMCKGADSDWLAKLHENKSASIDLPFLINQFDALLPGIYKTDFYGGEPFLIEEYYSIWGKIIEKNPKCIIDVQTNGSILNERVKQVLEKGRFRIGISLDSLNEETYSNIRRGGHLRIVLNNIEFFFQYTKRKNTHLYFAFCPITLNWKEIPEIIRFGNLHNADVFFNTVMEPHEISLYHLPCHLLKPIISQLENEKISSGNYTELINKRNYNEFLHELKQWHQQKMKIKKMYREELEALEGIPINEILNDLKSKYQECSYIANEQQNTNVLSHYYLVTEKLLDAYPHDIFLKKMLKKIIAMPHEKFVDFVRNKNMDELFIRSKKLYAEIKSSYEE
ncbi:MAG: radical SAM/SPASM domain-containing protein [Bacteroidota bacterium]